MRMSRSAKDISEPRVLYHKQDRVAYITLNRPHVLNALDTKTHEDLAAIWDDFEADDGIWMGVLTGSGRAFSVGQDLNELVNDASGGRPSSFGSRGASGYPRLTERFSLSKPLLARLNGYALGGGFELALACDVIVAADTAEFGLPEARLGLIPGAGGVFRLTRQIPMKVAMGCLLSGNRLTAKRAFELGLVNDVVPLADLDNCVERWVKAITSCSPLSTRSIKESASKSAHLSVEDAFGARYVWEERRRNSDHPLEGPRAFLEKRLPRWTDN